ncbi:MAG: HmuY family protein [Saprospiraceae bacterium]|nr:HmuY family protein [Saprospiraceae bacterium]
MFRNVLFVFLTGILMVSVSSCDKEEDSKPVDATVEISVSSNPAGEFTYFNFEKKALVTGTDVMNSSEWDFGLKLVSFIVNGGTDRVGKGGVIILDNTMDGVKTAPESGYKTDNGADTAIKDEWYTYNPVARTFTPKAGKVFVFKTAKEKYAKMEVIKADPTDDNGVIVTPPVIPTKIRYTIRYVFQPDGSRNFE